MQDGDSYVVFASKAGAPTNPGWYHNLIAHPDVQIEVGSDTLAASASEVTGEQREQLYRRMSAARPQFAEYEQKTDRLIPVIRLTPA
jgi:deazaflavin-dependent oxidoreductase (nitroreductase family)